MITHRAGRTAPEQDAPDELTSVALAAAGGDPAALAVLVTRTGPAVRRACAGLVDPGSADDLTQETFLRAVRSLPGYRGEAHPLRWLLTIARRVCADEIAQRKRVRETVARLRARRQPATSEPTVLVEIADALAELPVERREALVLTAIAGVSYAEAAQLFRCPVGTIRSRVARAREDLIAGLHGEPELAAAAGKRIARTG